MYKTIFAIDDDPISLLVIEEIVNELDGVQLHHFKRPTQLYTALLRNPAPSLIIVDVDLVKWNGIDVIEGLRLQAPNIASHVLFLGDKSLEDVDKRIEHIRDSAYMCKANLSSLIDILDSFFEAHGFGFEHPYLMCA